MANLSKCFTLFFAVVLVSSSLLLIEPAMAQFEKVPTYCDISVDNAVEGQSITVTIQMSPPTPTGDGYRVWMWITPPNPKDFTAGEPWLKNFVTASNGKSTVTFNVPAYSGEWSVDVSFGSNNFANHTLLYLAGHWQTKFTVYPAGTPTPTITTTPSVTVTQTASPMSSSIVPEVPVTTVLVATLAVASIMLMFTKKKLS